MQEDGVLGSILAYDQVLSNILEPLSGGEAAKEVEAPVREALAEAVVALAGTELGCSRLWDLRAPQLLAKGYVSLPGMGGRTYLLALRTGAGSFLFLLERGNFCTAWWAAGVLQGILEHWDTAQCKNNA